VRVAWVLYGDLAQRTGGTIYDREVVEGLRRAGDEVRVVSLPGRLYRELRAFRPDVVVGDELCFRELAIAFPMLGTRGPRRVLLVHHLTAWETELSPLRRRVARIVESVAIRASDRIVTTSHATRNRLVTEGTHAAIDVVLPGADRLVRHEPRPAGDGEAELAMVFVGSIVARKRVLELIKAFGGVRGRLLLVGSTTRDPRYAGEVRALIAQLGIGARVVLTGEVDDAAVARALASADVLAMPSSLEGYGIAATEAIHAGVPVIAARTPGLEEALSPCPDAVLFIDAHDPTALTTTLTRFASDTALRAAMRVAARAAAPNVPTWNACVAAFRAMLQR
jgi:glycosyltransferase involved in cell wall biosynthesis